MGENITFAQMNQFDSEFKQNKLIRAWAHLSIKALCESQCARRTFPLSTLNGTIKNAIELYKLIDDADEREIIDRLEYHLHCEDPHRAQALKNVFADLRQSLQGVSKCLMS